MLHNHENRHNKAGNHQSQVDFVWRERQLQVAHHRKSTEGNTSTDASYRDIFGRNRKNNPHAKGSKSCKWAKGQENTESRKHALASAETRKASEAVSQNHQQACHQRHPSFVGLSFAQLHGNPGAKEALEQIQEHYRKCRLPAQHAERVGETRILGTVVPDVEILTFRDFCYPNCAWDRPQQVRYRKTQQTVQVLRPF